VEARFLSYDMEGREVCVYFVPLSETSTEVIEVFDAETENPLDMQVAGWQAIIDNYALYCTSSK
jgi:hypothetical protein